MKTPPPIKSGERRVTSGFSLIEVLVGLLIGMLSVVVIMQVFGAFEGNKRSTTGGDDAQINGTIALYGLERDVREAGYGLNNFNLLGCSLSYTTTGTKKVAVKLSALAPVVINSPNVPAGDNNTDTLLIVFGNSNSPAEGDLISTAPSTGSYPITTPTSFAVDDAVIAQPALRPTDCALTLDKVKAITNTVLTVDPGTTSGLALGSVVFNLGQAPITKQPFTARAYRVRSGNLTVCDYVENDCGNDANKSDDTIWVPVASNIVSLRAQYGRDTTATSLSGAVGQYDQITPGKDDGLGFPVQCSWARTLAVRVAIVARSGQFTKYDAASGEAPSTSKAPVWAGSVADTKSVPSNPTAVTFDLSSNAEWKNYRYKKLETTVPIRNMVWQGSQGTQQGGSGGC
ncbi:UNVERIFIED_ORG: type IV pilus assembly protein PilW [Variovorax paradoxus]|nr:type IV pilus assembly protein PilW [Variovorax paradoxus]